MTGQRFPAPALGDADTVPRYEFRVWGSDLSTTEEQIVAEGGRPRMAETVEVYLPIKRELHLNPKIRRSVLDVKVLIDTVDGFERWEPQLKCVLPVGLTQLVDDFFPLVDLDPPELSRSWYSADTLVSEVVDPHPQLAAVIVMKTRRLYRIGRCTAEVSTVGVGNTTHHTVAIESTHLDALGALRAELGIDHRHNTSYPRMIQSLQGWLDA